MTLCLLLQRSNSYYNIYSYICHNMKIFPSNVSSFRGISEYQSHEIPGMAINSNNLNQNCQLKNTQSDDIQGWEADFFMRPSKKSLTRPQISFQKDFLVEHITSFGNQFQNLLEFARSTVKSIEWTPDLTLPIKQAGVQSSQSFLTILNNCSLVLSSDGRDVFVKDLPEYPDIQAFFNQILKLRNKELVSQLLIITIQLWKEMRLINFKFIERKELLKKAHVWSESHARENYNREGFVHVNLKKLRQLDNVSSQLVFDKFSHFFRYFVTTVLFVIAGFFQNPYMNQGQDIESNDEIDYPKRQSSLVSMGFLSNLDDFSDSEDMFGPKKRLKQ